MIGSPNPIPALLAASEPAQIHPTNLPAYDSGTRSTDQSLDSREE